MRRCWELDGITPYSTRARDYADARPRYPGEAMTAILAQLPRPAARVVDVGAGTGISTIQLAARAGRVLGIEPSPAMVETSPRCEAVQMAVGRAESLPLRDGSVDLLTAFNAFHWFRPGEFLAEAQRALRPSGRLALVWNDWDLRDAFTSAFVAIMRRLARDFPPEDRDAEVAPLRESPRFTSLVHTTHPNRHRLDFPRLLARLRSMSYVDTSLPEWPRALKDLTALFQGHADGDATVTHCYQTQVFVAAPRPPGQ